jgi:hypothetical protein
LRIGNSVANKRNGHIRAALRLTGEGRDQ